MPPFSIANQIRKSSPNGGDSFPCWKYSIIPLILCISGDCARISCWMCISWSIYVTWNSRLIKPVYSVVLCFVRIEIYRKSLIYLPCYYILNCIEYKKKGNSQSTQRSRGPRPSLQIGPMLGSSRLNQLARTWYSISRTDIIKKSLDWPQNVLWYFWRIMGCLVDSDTIEIATFSRCLLKQVTYRKDACHMIPFFEVRTTSATEKKKVSNINSDGDSKLVRWRSCRDRFD